MRSVYIQTLGVILMSVLVVSCGKKKSQDDNTQTANSAALPSSFVIGPGGYPIYTGNAGGCMGGQVYNNSNQSICMIDQQYAYGDYSYTTLGRSLAHQLHVIGNPFPRVGNARFYTLKLYNNSAGQNPGDDLSVVGRVGGYQFDIPRGQNNIFINNSNGPLQIAQVLDNKGDAKLRLGSMTLQLCVDTNRQPVQCP